MNELKQVLSQMHDVPTTWVWDSVTTDWDELPAGTINEDADDAQDISDQIDMYAEGEDAESYWTVDGEEQVGSARVISSHASDKEMDVNGQSAVSLVVVGVSSQQEAEDKVLESSFSNSYTSVMDEPVEGHYGLERDLAQG